MRELGDYAVRGGILDLFAAGMDLPVRLDFFGDTLETIRSFDPETQRTEWQLRALDLVPVAEFQLITETIRQLPHRLCGGVRRRRPDDLLYEAVSEGRRYPGMEHWLPLFHDKLDTLFDYLPGAPLRPRAARRRRGARAAARRSPTITRRGRRRSKHGVGTALQAAAAGPALSRRQRMERRCSTARRWRG